MYLDVECERCGSGYGSLHVECTEYIDYCSCHLDGMETFFCDSCNYSYERNVSEDSSDSSDHEVTPLSPNAARIYESFKKGTQLFDSSGYQKDKPAVEPCRHEQEKITLSDGTSIYCSSYKSTLESADAADYGLYADPIWRPVHRNELIDWPDFKIPTSIEISLEQIADAYYWAAAEENDKVQIGCIGGHGRTGTILACLALFASDGKMTPKEAIDFVREAYCDKAIEKPIQEWYVAYASHIWYETELPETPKDTIGRRPAVVKKQPTPCSPESHIAMYLNGYGECLTKKTCPFFVSDISKMNKEGLADRDKNLILELRDQYPEVIETGLNFHECTQQEHFQMMEEGHTSCFHLRQQCYTWEADEMEWSK